MADSVFYVYHILCSIGDGHQGKVSQKYSWIEKIKEI